MDLVAFFYAKMLVKSLSAVASWRAHCPISPMSSSLTVLSKSFRNICLMLFLLPCQYYFLEDCSELHRPVIDQTVVDFIPFGLKKKNQCRVHQLLRSQSLCYHPLQIVGSVKSLEFFCH